MKNKRITLTVSKEIIEAVDKLKKENYYDKFHSEVYRDALTIGLKELIREDKLKKFEVI